MTTLVKDTNKLIKFLQSKGYSQEQAEGFVEAVNEFDLKELAKSDQVRMLNTKMNFALGLLVGLFAGMFVLLLEKLVG